MDILEKRYRLIRVARRQLEQKMKISKIIQTIHEIEHELLNQRRNTALHCLALIEQQKKEFPRYFPMVEHTFLDAVKDLNTPLAEETGDTAEQIKQEYAKLEKEKTNLKMLERALDRFNREFVPDT